MRRRLVVPIFLMLSSIIFLLLMAIPTAFGDPLFQLDETQRAQTVEAFVNESFPLTQTALFADLNATANALFAPTSSPTPVQGQDARAPYQAAQHLGQGWEYYYDGVYSLALDEFNQTIDLAPNWAEGYAARGLTYVQTDRLSDAAADLEQAVALDNNDADLYAGWLCYAQNDLGQFQQAIKSCGQAVTLNPLYPTAFNNRGYAYAQIGRYEEAIADYTAAIRLDPTEPIYFGNRQRVYETQERWSLVVMDTYIGNGLDYLDDGNYGEAIASFTRAINQTSSVEAADPIVYAYAYFNLGRAHVDVGNNDLALEAFQTAIDLSPDFAAPYAWMGKIYSAEGNPDAALEYYDRALAVDPAYAEGYLMRAVAYDARQNHAAAVNDYWDWVRLSHARDVIWEPWTPGVPFTVGIEETWAYRVPFEGQIGQSVTLTADAVPGMGQDVDPLIIVLDPDGHPIAAATNLNSLFGGAALRNFVLPADGTYTAVISYTHDSGGAVRVQIDFGATLSGEEMTATVQAYTPTPTPTDTPTATPSPTLTLTPTATPTATPLPTPQAGIADFSYVQQLPDMFFAGVVTWQDDQHVIVSHASGFSRIDTRTGQSVADWSLPGSDLVTAAAISPDGKWFAAGSEDITIIDTASRQTVATLRGHADYLKSLAFSPDGTWLASSAYDGRLIVWSMTTFEMLFKYEGDYFRSLAISPDGHRLVTASILEDIVVWDTTDPANPQQMMTLSTTGEYSFNTSQVVAFSPDGSLLAGVSGSDIVLWDTATYTPVATLGGHNGGVNCLSFSADGTLLASASEDRTIKLWHVPSRELLATLGESPALDQVNYVAFNPAGDQLVSHEENYTIRLWRRKSAAASEPTATAVSPGNVETSARSTAAQYVTSGWSAYFQKDYAQAVIEFEQAIASDPDWTESYLGRGLARFRLRDYAAAQDDFDRVLKQIPDDGYTLSWRAALLANTGALTEALRDLNHLIELDQGTVSIAYDNRGYVYFRLKRYDEALADLTTAIGIQPAIAMFFDDRINVYEALGKVELALLDSYIRDGLNSFDDGQYNEAIQYFTQAINDPAAADLIDPVIYAYYNLGRAYAEMGDTAQALAAFQNANDLAGDYAWACNQMGKIYADQGDYETALTYQDRAIRADARLGSFFIGRAAAFDQLGRHDDAIPDYWQAINLRQAHRVDWQAPAGGQFSSISLQSGWVYTIPFEGQAGQVVNIRTEVDESVVSTVDPLIVVLDVDGEPVAADDNSGAGDWGDALDFVPSVDGSYTLVVSYSSATNGIVRFSLSTASDQVPLGPVVTPTYTPTPTVTPTPTPLPTPTVAPTPGRIGANPAALPVAVEQLGAQDVDFAFWQDDDHVITVGSGLGFARHTVGPDAPPPQPLREWDFVVTAAISPDGNILAYGGSDITLLDTHTGNEIGVLRGDPNWTWALAFSPDGSMLASSHFSGHLWLWDVAAHTRVFTTSDVYIQALAFSPDGNWLAVGTVLAEIQLWQVSDSSARLLLPLSGIGTFGRDAENVLAFSPDGTFLAGVKGSDILLWDARAHQLVAALTGHTSDVNSVAFNADGNVLASGSDDGSIRLWNVTDGTLIGVLGDVTENGIVTFVTFNPSGTRLLSRHAEGVVKVWEALPTSPQDIPVAPAHTETPTATPTTCEISAGGDVNMRSGPGVDYAVAGILPAGQTALVDGQAAGSDGFVWWHLVTDQWVRSDVVDERGDCEAVPVMAGGVAWKQ